MEVRTTVRVVRIPHRDIGAAIIQNTVIQCDVLKAEVRSEYEPK